MGSRLLARKTQVAMRSYTKAYVAHHIRYVPGILIQQAVFSVSLVFVKQAACPCVVLRAHTSTRRAIGLISLAPSLLSELIKAYLVKDAHFL